MADKIKLFVNGEEVEVEAGKNLVDAIGAIGIEIPHLCYHPALGADGNCRMCLVGIESGGPPIVPACKTRAQEGMKVVLDAENIKKIQRDVMEFELINHPIDCPVCDQAGECKLQDYYMSFDGAESRMDVKQVNKNKNLDFGGGVIHDQERCIVCGRCVRFLRQITKTGELGIINRTDVARVNIFPGRPIDNRYGLNVVDLCPVGAMTSSDFRFKQRVWFLKKVPSICHGCSKGCNITIDHNKERNREDRIYRFRPRLNEQVNGYFICDEGRLSYKTENEDRLTAPMIGGVERDMKGVLTTSVNEISKSAKPAFLISPDASLEEMIAVKALAEKIGGQISGFSDGYVKKGDGDDYLIQDDKAANRKGLELLGIDSSKEEFVKAMKEADLLVNFGSDLSLSYGDEEIKELVGSSKTIVCTTHYRDYMQSANIIIPVASFSEQQGCIVNCDGILQQFQKAVTRNNELPTLAELASQFGSTMSTTEEIFTALQQKIGALGQYTTATIPAEGLNLNDSEAANVTA